MDKDLSRERPDESDQKYSQLVTVDGLDAILLLCSANSDLGLMTERMLNIKSPKELAEVSLYDGEK